MIDFLSCSASRGLELYSYGLDSYRLRSYGNAIIACIFIAPYSYGLYALAYIVMAYIEMAYVDTVHIIMAPTLAHNTSFSAPASESQSHICTRKSYGLSSYGSDSQIRQRRSNQKGSQLLSCLTCQLEFYSVLD